MMNGTLLLAIIVLGALWLTVIGVSAVGVFVG